MQLDHGEESGKAAMGQDRQCGPIYRVKLFVAGNEPNSRLTRETLEQVARKQLAGKLHVEVIDVMEDFGTALEHGVLVAPTLIVVEPQPQVRITGAVQEPERLLKALVGRTQETA